ncbi:MAG: inositol monophosphatase family protein [Nitriliruptor sp.]|uniref:inositol monophosphatase family protein n=1 Tax=Nitriliruptor sp. TaxID=2448056 RepID=UPI0034A0A2B5
MAGPPPLQLAIDVAVAAGTLLADFAGRRRDGADIGVETKSTATDPVSEADRAAERLIAERLLTARPDDGLLGEEGQAPRAGTSGYRWVVDPLDGTVNFLYDRPAWCVSIACEDDRGSVVGVVHAPVLGETWVAERGGGARRLEDDRPLQVSSVSTLAQALVATGFAYDADVRAQQGTEGADLVARVRDVRRDGSAALDLAGVAAGRVDGYLEHGLQPWDLAAGSLLVTEAGGCVTLVERELAGQVLDGIVAGGSAVHDLLLDWEVARR